ncbi:uncharacterized protein LOC119072128 [Bradysia coprophila]|uniref:uncharacterized protein LOC119072128 n=1 Tax=Bradysia coprophila TaxID=38358 RepID=UPI00187DBD21|nr:uncharacterized protein LOC119072128 [Bradysia coprophila]
MTSEKYAAQKIQQLTSCLTIMFAGNQEYVSPIEAEHQKTKAKQFDDFIANLKTKFSSTNSKDEKYQILTMLPTEWSKGVMSVPNPKLPSNILQRSTKEAVQTFYLEDDISRMMPGKNDCVSMTVNGKKQKVQKRMILSTLRQTYQEFKNRHETIKVSLSYFMKCRPKNCIFLGAPGTHFICVCTIHQNVKQMVYSGKLSKHTCGELMHYEHCVAKVTCNPPQQKCFMRTCKNCPKMLAFKKYLINALKIGMNGESDKEVEFGDHCDDDVLEIEDVSEIEHMEGLNEDEDSDESDGNEADETEHETGIESEDSEANGDEYDDEEIIHFRQWVSTDRCEFKHFAMPISKFVDDFAVKLEKLITHIFITNEQTAFLKWCRDSLKIGEFLIWGDFAENFSFVIQNEAQGYHWARKQATVHPFVIYYKNEKNELAHLNYVIISDCLKHDSVAVYLFISKLVKFLEGRFKVITKLYYFTDGCAGQYKNRKNFSTVYYHKIDFGYECEWHFHATSHGKGPCDGIGGTLKRSAARASLGRTYEKQIDSAELLFEWASSSDMDMHFEYSTTAEHESMTIQLRDRFNAAKLIKGTLKYHCFIPRDSGELMVKYYSADPDHKMVKIV